MGISGAIGSARSGMQHQARRVGVSADNVANVSTPNVEARRAVSRSTADGGVQTTTRPTGAGVSLVDERVEQRAAVAGYRANAAVVRVADEMLGTLVDAFA